MSKPRVAILGLGIMGGGMASRLLSAGFPVAVYNRNPDKAAPFANAGAFVASSPREAASRADIIISMVADDIASKERVARRKWRTGGSDSRIGADRIQHTHRRLDQGARCRRRPTRIRVSRRAGHRHQAPCGIGRTSLSGWRLCLGSRHRSARPRQCWGGKQFTWAQPEAARS